MDLTILQHIRRVLSTNPPNSDINYLLAVQGIAPIMASYGMPFPEISLNDSIEEFIKPIDKYNKFFSIEIDTLNTLIILLHQRKELVKVTDYAASILRFAEINFPYLLKKTKEKKSFSANERRYFYMKVIDFLLDYYYYDGDLRYLNTCLKLMDYRWIFLPQNVVGEEVTSLSLLEYRLWIKTEYALDKLRRNE